MKAVLRFGALAVGVALTAGGAGEAAQPSRKPSQAAQAHKGAARKAPPHQEKASGQESSGQKSSSQESARPESSGPESSREEGERQGPARMGPARVGPASMDNAPRIADGKKDELADRKRDEAIEGFKRLIPKLQEGSHRKA
ncbi:MAG: tetratricopeptide repeat protein, partial [Archangium sp.]